MSRFLNFTVISNYCLSIDFYNFPLLPNLQANPDHSNPGGAPSIHSPHPTHWPVSGSQSVVPLVVHLHGSDHQGAVLLLVVRYLEGDR